MSTTDPLVTEEEERLETICEQEIGPLISSMLRARRKGASPQDVSYHVLHALRYTLKRWRYEGRLEPEDHALQQAIEHATRVSFGRWNDAPLNEWLSECKLELVAGRKMRRTK